MPEDADLKMRVKVGFIRTIGELILRAKFFLSVTTTNTPTRNTTTHTMESGTFKAWIEVDGEPLECYQVEAGENDKELTCWVASEAGKGERFN